MPTPKTITAKIVVPEWAKWIATDSRGQVSAFANKPVLILEMWWVHLSDSRCEHLCYTTPPRNWRKTLRRVK